MKLARKKSRKPVRAAGGIVVRASSPPLFAVVQMRKFDAWVLPKGKLNRGEAPLEAARREVLEETGHEVSVHEFIGTLAYEVGRRPKIVQFWRMQALSDQPAYELMNDVKAVRWLPLEDAIAILTHLREREFLRSAGHAITATGTPDRESQRAHEQAAGPSALPPDEPRRAPGDRHDGAGVERTNWPRAFAETIRGWVCRVRPARPAERPGQPRRGDDV